MALKFQKLVLTGFLLGLTQAAAAGEFTGSSGGSSRLDNVHKAFLAKDFTKMAGEMKKTLLAAPNDSLTKENIFGVYRKAAELQGSAGLPADWKLPSEIKRMKVVARRNEGQFYSIKVQGNLVTTASIEQLQVTRFADNAVMIDKSAGVGGWFEKPSELTHDREYWSESRKTSSPPATGLYLIKVALKSGKTVDGWFILDDQMIPSATPEITSPAVEESLRTVNPTFKWIDFRSPQYKPYEQRSMWVAVYNYGSFETLWSLFQKTPSSQEATVSRRDGNGVDELNEGHYRVTVSYSEMHRFGDLVIGREATTNRNFSIQR